MTRVDALARLLAAASGRSYELALQFVGLVFTIPNPIEAESSVRFWYAGSQDDLD
jgi:hypothetical protein